MLWHEFNTLNRKKVVFSFVINHFSFISSILEHTSISRIIMSFDTSWDVDKYKSEFENDEHWQLRRQFLVEHKDKYPEDRLVCLAQVFFNVEFLGCK